MPLSLHVRFGIGVGMFDPNCNVIRELLLCSGTSTSDANPSSNTNAPGQRKCAFATSIFS